MVILSMMVTTWLHYRRKRRETGGVFLSIGLNPGEGEDEVFVPVRESGKTGSRGTEDPEEEDQEYKDTVYKGILWMKEKYEQYRDMSDQRYERLKEELGKAEKKYEDLLTERNQQIVFLQRQLDQRIKDFHLAEQEGREARGQIQQLEEQSARTRQRLEEEVDRIRHQLEDEIANTGRKLEEKQRMIADLLDKLRNNSQLLLNIYQELDKSLRTTDAGSQM
jgi:DNA repair exonuclease SbcCD ATPase subunit